MRSIRAMVISYQLITYQLFLVLTFPAQPPKRGLKGRPVNSQGRQPLAFKFTQIHKPQRGGRKTGFSKDVIIIKIVQIIPRFTFSTPGAQSALRNRFRNFTFIDWEII